jgi:glycosyltransferase A (GT-A) superfamily protein (DUF2064 family)
MKNAEWELFNNINWSTEEVLKATLNNAQKINKSVKLLTELTDIDTEKDWNDYLKKNNPK